jgi:predicted metal-binding membrane protein
MRYATGQDRAMSKTIERAFSHLPPAAGRLGAALLRPKSLAAACVMSLAALGWCYLALSIVHMSGPLTGLGPGMGALDLVPRVFAALCRPTFGLPMPQGAWGFSGFVVAMLMWSAMIFAMMLPSAGPMILTYAEIAETAARQRQTIVSPLLIAAGYTAVWTGFASAATLAQFVFTWEALINTDMAATSALFSGLIFIVAGLYQFSSLKQACLRQCQSPFTFFLTHWQTGARGVFRLGLQQGLYCLGCCWAMMLVMFSVGVMNVIWMAALGMAMTLEKMVEGRRLATIMGLALIAVGAGLVLSAAPWPLNVL